MRKVRLTASEVGFAKNNNIKLEDLAKSKLPKRGRPKGSKNKPKIIKMLEVQVEEGRKRAKANQPESNVDSFSETLKEWDRMENEVDFKDLCQKLQEALAKSYCDYEQLEKNIAVLRDEIVYRDVIIRYLENRKV